MQEFICNVRTSAIIELNCQLGKISLRPSAQSFISMSHTCRRLSVSCCWDMHWQLFAWVRVSRGTTWCPEAEFNKMHLFFVEECKYTHMISLFVYSRLSTSSYICHGFGPLFYPFRSDLYRSLFKVQP
jgi:hypothetical protein